MIRQAGSVRWSREAAALGAAVLLWPAVASAADFRARATGHVFRCGTKVVTFPTDAPATLATGGEAAILAAQTAHWAPHRVTLDFGEAGAPVSLSEYGSTVTLDAGAAGAACVRVR